MNSTTNPGAELVELADMLDGVLTAARHTGAGIAVADVIDHVADRLRHLIPPAAPASIPPPSVYIEHDRVTTHDPEAGLAILGTVVMVMDEQMLVQWDGRQKVTAYAVNDPNISLAADSPTPAEALQRVLLDIVEHGLRADLNPGVLAKDIGEVLTQNTRYLHRIDEAMRERARAGLEEAKLRAERERLTTTETDEEATHA